MKYYAAKFDGEICPVCKALETDNYFVAKDQETFLIYFINGLFPLAWLEAAVGFKKLYFEVSEPEYYMLVDRLNNLPEVVLYRKKQLTEKLMSEDIIICLKEPLIKK